MTLNITLLTPALIYQSADYRLSIDGKPLHQASTKTLVLNDAGLNAFITYTGIGLARHVETRVVVRRWVRELRNPSFDEVVEHVRLRAGPWLARSARGEAHSFVIAGFDDGVPRGVLVSNFETVSGSGKEVYAESSVSSMTVRDGAALLVTGTTKAMPRAARKLLLRRARDTSDAQRIRCLLADANAQASSNEPNLISRDCLVYSQDINGAGHYQPFGQTAVADFFSHGLMEDPGVRALIEAELGKNARMVGATSGTSQPRRVTFMCSPECSDPGDSGIELALLPGPEHAVLTALAINASGAMVGQGSVSAGTPNQACRWSAQGEFTFLGNGGGLVASARAINEAGMAAGEAEWPHRRTYACIWPVAEAAPQALRLDDTRASGAWAINSAGDCAGWISIHPTESGQLQHRPALWRASGAPVQILDLESAWGAAALLNDAGQMLVTSHKTKREENSPRVTAWLWDGNTAHDLGAPPRCDMFLPLHLSADGVVAGHAVAGGRSAAALRSAEGKWSLLCEWREDRQITAIDEHLTVAGHDTVRNYAIPWIKALGEEMLFLPCLHHHHHYIHKLGKDGLAVGRASADHCGHALLWHPS